MILASLFCNIVFKNILFVINYAMMIMEIVHIIVRLLFIFSWQFH
jgi:hypothetical protein